MDTNVQVSNSAQIAQNQLLSVALTSPALEWQSDKGGRNSYPAKVLYANFPFREKKNQWFNSVEDLQKFNGAELTLTPADLSFERFWNDYKKYGTKKLAEEQYKKLKDSEKIRAIDYISKYQRKKQMEGTALIYAERYLKNKVWEI